MKRLYFLASVLLFSVVAFSQSIISSEDFEGYADGDLLSTVGAANGWGEWSGGSGTAESAVVTSVVSMSGGALSGRSFNDGTTTSDAIYSFPLQTTGDVSLKMDLFVDAGSLGGYIGLGDDNQTDGSYSNHAIYLMGDTAMYVTDSSAAPVYYGPVTPGVWNSIEYRFDLDNGTCEFFLNGTSVGTGTTDMNIGGFGSLDLWGNAIDLVAGAVHPTGSYYFDNIQILDFTTLVSFDQSSVTFNENAGTISANITITNPNASPTSVDVVLGASTATLGVDFSYTTPTTVTFPAGSSTTQSIVIGIIDDAIIESTENIILNLTNPTNSAIIDPISSQTINITDNDAAAPTLSFDQSSVTYNENAGTISANITITNPNASATSVDVALGGGTATSGLDYSFTPTTVTFPAGSSATQAVTLAIIDDAMVEPTETIILSLQNPSNSAIINPNTSQTINITDNDVGSSPSVSFDGASLSVNENAGTVMVNITITNPNASPTSVDVALGASTATIGVDFSYTTPTTVTFPAGSSATQSVVLGIIDDAVVESTEDIVLNLTNPTNNANISPNGSHTISIIDNEPAPDVEVSFDAASITVDESAGTVLVDVLITNPNANPTSVDIVLGASTATIGADFSFSTPTTVTFPAGSSVTQNVVVGIIDDATVEGTENIVLNVQNPTNGAIIGTNGSYTINITDNDGSAGLEENESSLFILFPNPTTNSFTITSEKVINSNFRIMDGQGRAVLTGTMNGQEHTMDISKLSKGVYSVVFEQQDLPVLSVVKE